MGRKVNFVCAWIIAAASYSQQYYTKYYPKPGRTMNHTMEVFTDANLATSSVGNCVNGIFIGPEPLGIDRDSTDGFIDYDIKKEDYPFLIRGIGLNNDSLLLCQPPARPDTIINGKPFKYFNIINISKYKDGKKINWITLEDIKKKYFPEAKKKCIYTVNKFIIPNREELYKFDPDFIYRIEMTQSTDIEGLAELPEFSIIRIFTKTKNNYHVSPFGQLVESFSK